MSAYANAVSTSVICELLGIPRHDLEFFRDVTRISGSRNSTAEQVSEASAACSACSAGWSPSAGRNPATT